MISIDDIRFIEHGGRYGNALGCYMPGGYWVSKERIVFAWEKSRANQQQIDWSGKVCAETLIGTDTWKSLSFGHRLALGRCIKCFCNRQMLPIEVANPDKKGKRLYRRKK